MSRVIAESIDIGRALKRVAHEIIEKNRGVENLALVGVLSRGAPLAERLANQIEAIEGQRPLVGSLDITLYRDDVGERTDWPLLQGSALEFDVGGKHLVIIDDVFYTGRTARAAMDALIDMGRPARISLAVLVDRGHRELPIRADFVGINVPSQRADDVQVMLKELDGKDEVYVAADK